MSTTVVLGYDGSPAGQRALEEAAEQVRRAGEGGRVVVVTAFEVASVYPAAGGIEPPFVPALPQGEQEIAEQLALELALRAEEQLIAAGIDCTRVVAPGDQADALVAAVAEHDARMVVVGNDHHGALGELFGGSVTHRLLNRCRVPVLVVPPPAE